MNIFEKILYLLQAKMETPISFGWFHFLWIFLVCIAIIALYKRKKYYSERQLKIVLGSYGIVALVLEVLKQLIWAFNYNTSTNLITWNYEWYAFPFQLCTTPIFVSLICLFLKKGKIRDSLLSYMAYVTILGSIATIIIPDSCFTSYILVNIHTMWLHFGSFVVSVYLLITNEVKTEEKYLKKAIIVFLIFVVIAQMLNVVIYQTGILNGETFNMFYISPYFISALPVFDMIQTNVPYVIFLTLYVLALSLGACIIYFIGLLIKKIKHKLLKKGF